MKKLVLLLVCILAFAGIASAATDSSKVLGQWELTIQGKSVSPTGETLDISGQMSVDIVQAQDVSLEVSLPANASQSASYIGNLMNSFSGTVYFTAINQGGVNTLSLTVFMENPSFPEMEQALTITGQMFQVSTSYYAGTFTGRHNSYSLPVKFYGGTIYLARPGKG